MGVVIKNNGIALQKSVLFGYYDNCWGKSTVSQDEDFLSLNTGKDISISIDGNSTESKRLEFLKSLSGNYFNFSSIEYSNSDVKNIGNTLHWYESDANGKLCITKVMLSPIIIQSFVTSTQTTIFPIVIPNKSGEQLKPTASILLLLQPNEEIKLKFVK